MLVRSIRKPDQQRGTWHLPASQQEDASNCQLLLPAHLKLPDFVDGKCNSEYVKDDVWNGNSNVKFTRVDACAGDARVPEAGDRIAGKDYVLLALISKTGPQARDEQQSGQMLVCWDREITRRPHLLLTRTTEMPHPPSMAVITHTQYRSRFDVEKIR